MGLRAEGIQMDLILGIGSMVMLAFAAFQLAIAVICVAGAMIMLPLVPLTIAVEAWLKLKK
jgi:hypothetical protein